MTDIADLAGRFTGRLLTTPEAMAPFLTDWRKLWRGNAAAVAMPETTQGVADIVRWCGAHGMPIVPQGGNTGLSGGATPDASGRALILSLTRLNRIRAVDPAGATMTVDAGCVLKTLQDAADSAGMIFPLSLAAEGSCTIGGNLATNAGGTAVLRYGNARALCLGIEVVTAEGVVWDGLRQLRKDNSGYDLRDLFIGSEGTLGIITGAVLQLFPKPAGRACAFLALDTPDNAVALLGMARASFGLTLTGVELLSDACLALVVAHNAAARRPLGSRAPWYLLVELSGPDTQESLGGMLEAWLEAAMEAGHISDGAIAQSESQAREFWALREAISESQGAEGATIKHDICLPVSRIAEFLAEAGNAVAARWPTIRPVVFGHVGDGNIHYNFSPPVGGDAADFLAQQRALNRIVHDIAVRFGGSISAEHGLGVLRRDEAAHFRPEIETRLMHAIKHALDPAGLMNPGKVLP